MNTTLINENMYQLLLSAKDSVGILLFQMIMLEMALLFIRTIRNDIQRRRTGNENGYKKDTFWETCGNYMVCVAAAFLVLTAANQLIVAKGLAIYMLVLSEGVVLGCAYRGIDRREYQKSDGYDRCFDCGGRNCLRLRRTVLQWSGGQCDVIRRIYCIFGICAGRCTC